jgi:hypothetical protein
MLPELSPHLIPLLGLYPELHYRFKAFPFSLYYRRQPELICDAPRRLEPGQPLPVLLIIKDADRFPCHLQGVNLDVKGQDTYYTHHINFGQEFVTKRWWHHLEWIDLPDESPCEWEIRPSWRVQIRGRFRTVKTDNLPGLSHDPLRIRQSGYPLPREDGWTFGDLHAHTAYTEDQIEFGAPLAAYPPLGSASGLSFAFTADHSYDLDDLPGSFNQSDPRLTRFQERAAEIDRLNGENAGSFALLPGYELSCANSRGKNIHLLLLQQKRFLPGSGDSAEYWFKVKSELSLDEALQRRDEGVLPIAAHPLMKVPILESWLLGRDSWRQTDLDNGELFGLQVWNGGRGRDFHRGLTAWIEGLLKGRRWKILAGSDAHGNFNRYRQVGFPMLKLSEADRQIFGEARTGIRLHNELNVGNIGSALKTAPSLVSDGPFASLNLAPAPNGSRKAVIRALSNPEFGSLRSVKLYWGAEGEPEERILLEETQPGGCEAEFTHEIAEMRGYLRLEVTTETDKLCLTNPLFIESRER